MEKTFSSLLNRVMQYERNECLIVITLFVPTFLAIVIFAIKSFKRSSTGIRVLMVLISVILLVIFIAYIINFQIQIDNIEFDISNGKFSVYTGNYIHDNYQKDSFYHNLYIFDDDGKKLLLRLPDYSNIYKIHTDFQKLPIGEFRGTVVYSENSKIVLDWSIES